MKLRNNLVSVEKTLNKMSVYNLVEDQLYKALNMSAPSLVELFMDLAKRSKNAVEFERVFQENSGGGMDIPKSFFLNVMDILQNPEKYEKKKKTAPAPAVEDDADELPPATTEAIASASTTGSTDEPSSKKPKLITSADHHLNEEEDQAELERLNKKLQGEGKKKGPTNLELGTFATEEERKRMVKEIRAQQEITYMKEREQRQIELSEILLASNKQLLQGVHLSKEEEDALKLQEESLRKAKDNMKRREDELDMESGFYQMPGAQQGTTDSAATVTDKSAYDKLLNQSYKEDRRHKDLSEQELLERDILRKAMGSYQASMGVNEKKEWDFVMENSVKFQEFESHGGDMQIDYKELLRKQIEDQAKKAGLGKEEAQKAGMEAIGKGGDGGGASFAELTAGKGYYDARQQQVEKQRIEMEAKRTALEEGKKNLPVYKWKEPLCEAIREYQILILVGETGSGKTTQVPQYLLEMGYGELGKIGCTQPRRVAAMSVATRVAEECGVRLGAEVGYTIRFEDKTSDKTVIKYMTDGMLLRDFLNDPELSSYSVLIIDEAHERTLQTDILFGLVKDVCKHRHDFKVIISSATLDAEKFANYFEQCPTFNVPGRRFPVAIHYTTAPEPNYAQACAHTVMQIHLTQPSGDILVFMSGVPDIEAVTELLTKKMMALGKNIPELIINQIYASLPTEMQQKIFEPTPLGARKVVLATNIAETSITIDGIVYVVDTGYCKQNNFTPATGMSSLTQVAISKAAADQRAGRAGRVRPGKCYRLYTKWSYEQDMDAGNTPEILRSDLCQVVLMLKIMKVHDVLRFDFIDPPATTMLVKSLETLFALMALNNKGELTTIGRRMAEFPLEPKMAKALIASEKYGVSEEVTMICSVLSAAGGAGELFYRPKDKQVHADNMKKNFHKVGGDHFTLLNIYQQWIETNYSQQWCQENFVQFKALSRARDIYDQLIETLKRVDIQVKTSHGANEEGIKKSFLSGYFMHGARLNKNGSYTTIKNPHTVDIHPSSCLVEFKPVMVCYYELWKTGADEDSAKEYMRECIDIQAKWLAEVAPYYYKPQELKLDQMDKKRSRGVAVMQ